MVVVFSSEAHGVASWFNQMAAK
eukprot:COSAG05_NODE_16110_length_353_cov_0.818898_1_plen_22_part_10